MKATSVEIRPLCKCHGEPMLWNKRSDRPAGGSWRCRVKHYERSLPAIRRWKNANPKKVAATIVRCQMLRLQRGERVMDGYHHHKAMALWKAELGDPRPEGLTLSLVNLDSPSVYEGHRLRKGKRYPWMLSTDPGDYVWETLAANNRRKRPR